MKRFLIYSRISGVISQVIDTPFDVSSEQFPDANIFAVEDASMLFDFANYTYTVKNKEIHQTLKTKEETNE